MARIALAIGMLLLSGTAAAVSPSGLKTGGAAPEQKCGRYGDVPHDRAPVVSRDGATLAWTREFPRGRARIMVAAADGSRPRRIDSPGELEALSQDGREALLLDSRFSSHLLADTRTDRVRQIPESEARRIRRLWRTPEWSPDGGSYLEVRTSDPFRSELWLVPAEGGPGRRIFRPDRDFSQLHGPAWSPDGTTIAFHSRPRDGDEFATAVWVVRPDATGARQITNTFDSHGVKWSPDGRLLVFGEHPSKAASRVGVVRPDGSGLRWLTQPHRATGGQSTQSPSWLGNDRIVFVAAQGWFNSANNRVVVLQSIRLDGGGERRVTYHCHLGLRGRDRSYYGSHLSDLIRTFGGGDLVYAGPGDDDVDAGAGADRVFAGSGRDLVRARDESRDVVGCGPGRDTVVADPRDRIGRDCERVVRR